MKKTLIALMALAGVACGQSFTENGSLTAPENLYAPAFDFTFELTEEFKVTDDYDILLAYYQVSGFAGSDGFNVNAFQLSNAGVLTLVRGNTLTLTEGELTSSSTLVSQNVSTFVTTEGTNYTLTSPGIYKVDYLGGTNGSAAADLYKDGVKVASFTGGNHNMNGDGTGSLNLTVKVNDSLMIPEPTTATLSLLALAGLAARRRRH